MKKTLIIGLVAATLGLAGCQKDDTTGANDMQSTSTATTPAATTQPAAAPAQEKEGSKS